MSTSWTPPSWVASGAFGCAVGASAVSPADGRPRVRARAARGLAGALLAALLVAAPQTAVAKRHRANTHVRASSPAAPGEAPRAPGSAPPRAPARGMGATAFAEDRGAEEEEGTNGTWAAPQPAPFRTGAQLSLGEDLTPDTLGDVLESVATGQKEFVFTVVDMPPDFRAGSVVLEWLRNFMYNLQRVGRAHNVMIVATNGKGCELIRSADIPCYVDLVSDKQYAPVLEAVGPKPIGGKIAILKWIIASEACKNGFHGLYAHYTAVALRDPFRRWDRTYDFQGLSDVSENKGQRDWFALARECKTYAHGQEVHFVSPVKVCMNTELWFFRSSQASQALFDGMLYSLTNKPGEWEQVLFQWAVLAYVIGEGSSPVLRFRLLDVEEYASIPVYRQREHVAGAGRTENSIVMLAPTQMVEGMKRDAVASQGRWSPDRWNLVEAGKQRSNEILDASYKDESERTQAFLNAMRDPERQTVRDARARASYNWERAGEGEDRPLFTTTTTTTTEFEPGSDTMGLGKLKWGSARKRDGRGRGR